MTTPIANTQQTAVIGVVTVLKALVEFESRVGNGDWVFDPNHPQAAQLRNLFTLYAKHREGIVAMQDTKGLVHEDYEVLNRFLADNGFQIRLNPFDGLGLVAIVDRMFEWVAAADVEAPNVYVGSTPYPTFRIDARGQGISFYHNAAGRHSEPIVELATKSGDRVFMTRAAQRLTGFALYDAVYQLATAPMRQVYEFGGVIIPQVRIDLQPDISLLNGVALDQHDYALFKWRIVQAFQQVKFLMNKKGARLREATAMAVMLGVDEVERDLVLDRPFYLWAMPREGFNMPIMAMYIAPDCWQVADDLNAI